ncbi:thymidine kinase [Gracilimonas amylolytica]|uniref:thymidine kinase n=1 Tax=Gracilimonas amylolytica TaxID=1749045 RepID=UPI000CD8AF0E|nr:thymidine kinase [Gracilimonas amylolytica]
MINEPSLVPREVGWIEVVCGGMFSGKTEELIRRAKRAHIAGQHVVIVKPSLDKRYSDEEVVSHNETALPSILVDTADQIVLLTSSAKVVCIDEAQFFDDRVVEVANTLANGGKRVIVAGLDMDSDGKPFGPMPYLLAIAEYVTKLHAICAESGTMAHYSQSVVEKEDQVLVGEYDSYEPRARHCFRPPYDKRRGKPIKPFRNANSEESKNRSSEQTQNELI